jgi:tRNA pseudouridine13 synthase
MDLPLATPDLPGTGGHIGPDPADFRVTEVARYGPSGEGDHCFVRIRKHGLTSWEAAARLARGLGRRPGDVGIAGIKDQRAVAEQWLSVPDVTPAAVRRLALPGVEILEAACHGHKLRTGHLAGNRFVVRLYGVGEGARARAEAILERLARVGAYHYYGPQRFGSRGDNAQRGRELLVGRRRIRDRRQRRLVLSALQSELFNAYLVARVEASLAEPLPGELVQKTDSGGVFAVEDIGEVAGRLARREVVVTGPLFGPKMRRPEEGTAARALEERVLADAGLAAQAFEPWKRIAPGARRPLLLWPRDPGIRALDDGDDGAPVLEVRFELAPGGYATVILREITKTPFEAARAAACPRPGDILRK